MGEGRKVKVLQQRVEAVSALEPEMEQLHDSDLKAKTDEFRERLEGGETIDDILPEAFAVVREVSRRTLGMRPFDVQIMGGIVLHEGKIAEMKTGEGKTLAATMPVYLNALEGKGVHVVTVNDYLARRDAAWMGEIYAFLGLEVGLVQEAWASKSARSPTTRTSPTARTPSSASTTCRDNIATTTDQLVQRDLNFAIVDEVDSILVDEARTPLIISGMPESAADVYYRFAAIVPRLVDGEDYEVDEKKQQVAPTESGVEKVENALGIENLYDDVNTNLVNHLNQALRAQTLFHKDDEYIVTDGQVYIVDEFTGRVLEGRRYSEGLHQAIEAKEGRGDPGGEPDRRHHHHPELLQDVRQALGHDGHRGHRGRRVHAHLQDGGRLHPDAQGNGQGRQGRPGLQDREGEVQGRRRRHSRAEQGWASPSSSARSRWTSRSGSPHCSSGGG